MLQYFEYFSPISNGNFQKVYTWCQAAVKSDFVYCPLVLTRSNQFIIG